MSVDSKHTWQRASVLVAMAWLGVALPGIGAEAGYAGLSLDAALQKLSGLGLNIIYSDALVRPDMIVGQEPQGITPRAILEELVAPHRLRVIPGPLDALLLTTVEAGDPASPVDPTLPVLPIALDEVIVSASHYRLDVGGSGAPAVLTAGDIDLLPGIGNDPLRAVERLPGVARQDFNSKPRLRGGVDDETLVRFDDLRLYNPYHLKDFQNLLS